MNMGDMSAVLHAQAAGDCDDRNHPNHPDNWAGALAADLIASEADAIMAECADFASAYDFAENWEALLEQRGPIIHVACKLLAEGDASGFSERSRFAVIGRYVVDRIRDAAMQRAAHQMRAA